MPIINNSDNLNHSNTVTSNMSFFPKKRSREVISVNEIIENLLAKYSKTNKQHFVDGLEKMELGDLTHAHQSLNEIQKDDNKKENCVNSFNNKKDSRKITMDNFNNFSKIIENACNYRSKKHLTGKAK